MATIYEKTPGALIATPGRTVNFFDSGIVRVDRTYVCATSSASVHRANLVVGSIAPDEDAVQTLDGLYIHPTPGELERGNGFTEFKVSSFGRTSNISSSMLVGVRKHRQDLFENNTGSINYSVWTPAGSIVLKPDEALNFDSLNLSSDLLMPFNLVLNNVDSLVYSFADIVEIGPVFTANNMAYAAIQYTSDTLYSKRSSIDTSSPNLIQAYRATFTSQGNPDRLITFWVYQPVITIKSQNVFGTFSEIKYTSDRDNGGYAFEAS